MKDLVERLTDVTHSIEEMSRRIAHIRAGEMHHQVRFGTGPWEDSTQFILAHYENVLETYKSFADDLRQRINNGES